MIKFLGILVIAALSSANASAVDVEKIRRKDLIPAKSGMQGEQEFQKEVKLSSRTKLLAKIEVSTKGNGSLKIGNLNLRVVDDHNNGVYYENGLLNIDFVDLDRDGKRELVIAGIVCFTDEKGDTVLRREAVCFIYRLQGKRRFVPAYANTDFRLD